MELRRYWQIILRYWYLVVIFTVIGAVLAYQYYKSSPPAYQASAVVSIYQQPSPGDNYSGLYAAQASEFAGDDFIEIIQGNQFMSAVADQLKEIQINLTPDELKGIVTVERNHRELTITATNGDQNTALQVARAVASVIKNNANNYLTDRSVVTTVLDIPTNASLSGGRTVLLAAVRVIAGLLAGLALAFLLSYLNNNIRTKSEAEEVLDLPVLGYVPGVVRATASNSVGHVANQADTVTSKEAVGSSK